MKTLSILPGPSSATSEGESIVGPRSNSYKLEPASDGRCEIFILRHGDAISLPGTNGYLEYIYQTSEVQVNSSAAEIDRVEAFKVKDVTEATPEDETEDEAIVDGTVTEVPRTQPVTQQTKSQPSATPKLATHPSAIVQETPTTDRTIAVVDIDDTHAAAAAASPRVMLVAETFSTARTGQSSRSTAQGSVKSTDGQRAHGSPEVRIDGRPTRKRPNIDQSSDAETKPSTKNRSAKRMKNAVSSNDNEDDANQTSPLDRFNANPTRKTYSAKAKNRSRAAAEVTPTKSSRSSQRSVTVTAYEGEAPRVATSNSAIKDGSTAVKFLKKQGGTLLASVEEKCNVLWYVKS